MRTFVLVAVLLLIPVHPAAAAADKWSSIQSKNISIVGDASDAQLRHVAEEFEQLRTAIESLLSHKIQDPTVTTTVIVFKNDSAFKPFKPANSTAVFQPGADVNYIAINAELDMPQVILREYVRLTLRDMAGSSNLPLWFTEGLADYFGTLEVNARDRKFVIGHPIAEHMTRLSKAQLLPLETLFGVNKESPQYSEKDKQGLFQAESWALVHYLMLGDNAAHQKKFADFVNAIAAGRPTMESFQIAFQTDLPAVQKELERYIHVQSALPSASMAMKSSTEFDRELQASSVSDAASQFYLGDFLFHLNKLSDAEDLLKKAIVADPNLGGPLVSLGMLRMKQKKYGEATDLLKKAVALDSKNYLAHYDYAYLLNQEMQDTGDMSSENMDIIPLEFHKAIELQPHFVQAYEMFAYFNLAQGQGIDETIQLVRKAREYSPGRDSLTMMLAQLMLRQKNFVEARSLLNSLTNGTSADPSQRHMAANLLDEATTMEALQRDRVRREQEASRSEVIEITADSTPAGVVKADPLGTGPKTGIGVIEEITPARAKVSGEHVTGMLTLIDCRNGLTLTVKTTAGDVKLHSENPANIQFVSYTSSVSTDIQCGPAKEPGISVTITYKPASSPDSLGEPLLVEFLGG